MMGGLRTRLLLMVLVPLAAVLVVAVLSARETRDDALDDVRSNVQAFAGLAASWVEQRVDISRELAAGLAREPAVRRGGPGCERLLATELHHQPSYESLVVAGPDGRITCSGGPPARRGTSVADAEWFRRPRATGRADAAGDFSRTIDTDPALVVAVPFRGRDGRSGGVVAGAIDIRALNRLASSIDLPPSASLVVLSLAPGGAVLARTPDPERFVGRRVRRAGVVRAALAGRRVSEQTGLDGVRRIYGFQRVNAGAGDSLVVSVGLSRAEAGKAADRTLRRTLLLLALVAAMAVILVLALGNLLIARPMVALTRASRRVAAGDLGARSGLPRRAGEVGQLATSFDEMVGTLESRQDEIDRSASERQRLLAELVAAEEEERKRIAADIHDDSIQALAALLLRLELLESRLEDEEHRRSLGEAREEARDAVGRLRHLMFKLSPPALETSGLGPALSGYLEEISRVWGPQTALESTLAQDPSAELRALVYRIAVEAVNNAAKHAGASRIEVTLSGLDGGVRVRVRDDGEGFDVAAAEPPVAGHLGLHSMRERAESAGGWWRVESAPGAGTTVEFFVPDR